MTLRSDSFIPLLRANDPALFELSFAGRYPTGATLRLLGDALRRNTSLKRLNLSDCSLKDADVIPFVELLAANNGLTHLTLSKNAELTDATADALTRCAIDQNDCLSYVYLDGTAVSPSKAEDLTFVMSLNKFPKQLKSQAYKARMNTENFFTFELTHEPSDPKVYNEESARIVATCLTHNTIVRTLKLDRCCVGEHSVTELRPLLLQNVTLRRISLRDNYLSSDSAVMIANAIEKLGDRATLEDLDLSCNDIDDVGCDRLAEVLTTNSSLRVVTLLRNRCSQLALDRVKTGCALNCEPAQLKPILNKLQSDDATIQVVDMQATADTALRGPGRGYFTSLGAATISEALLYNTAVHTIILSGNHVGPDGAKALASMIARNSTVTCVNLSGNPINDEGARHLLIALRKNDSLVELNCTACNVSSKSMVEISALCHLNAQPLPIKEILTMKTAPATLDFSYRSSQPRGKWTNLHAESMQYVTTILKKNRHVTELNLSDNMMIGDDGIAQLIPLLHDPNCMLRKLILPNTSITDQMLDALTSAMRVNYTLKSIVVAPNPSTTTKKQHKLDDAVQLNHFPCQVKDIIPSLTLNADGVCEVSFVREDNEEPFGDDAVRVLANALQNNTKVHTVRLRRHRVSNRGIGYLSELLLNNSHITNLDVAENDIGPDGVEEFATMLEQNTSLLRCNLSKNDLTDAGGVLLLKALQVANRTLQELDVSDCRLLPTTQLRVEAQTASNSQPAYFRTYVLDKLSSTPVLKFYGDVSVGFLDRTSIVALLLSLKCQPSTSQITTVAFPFNKIDESALSVLEDVVKILPSLTELDLTDNLIESSSIPIVERICRSATQLKQLKLSPSVDMQSSAIPTLLRLHHNDASFVELYSKWERAMSTRKAPSPGESSRRFVLDIIDMQFLSADPMTLLMELFQRFNALKDIRAVAFSNVKLSVDCIGILTSFLGDQSLEGLRFEHCDIIAEGASDLGTWIERLPTLLVCDVVNTALQEEVCDRIQRHVAANRAGVAMNIIEDVFARPVAAASEAMKRRAGRAAGSAIAAVRTVEEERAVFAQIMADALQEIPNRKPYVRGMYIASKTENV